MPRNDAGAGPTLLERLADSRPWQPPAADEWGILRRSTATSEAEVSYPVESLHALDQQRDHGWWNEHRVRWALGALRHRQVRDIVEVGAGGGAMARRLAQEGLEVLAVEPLQEGARRLRERGGVTVFCGTLSDLALPADSVPALGYFDVIEHLQAPDAEMREACRVLEPGGTVLITVPAYQWLWSDEDECAGHFRRYTRRALTELCARQGLSAVRVEYLFASLTGPAFVLRRLPYLVRRAVRGTSPRPTSAVARQLDPHPVVAYLLDAVLRAEASLARRRPLPVGLSVAGVFVKTRSGSRGQGG